MRHLVPLESDQGGRSRISSRFRRARLYAIVSCKKSRSETKVEIRAVAGSVHEGECGATDVIKDLEVDAVIVKGIGIRAIQILGGLGLKVYRTNSETLAQAVRS